MLLLLIQSHIGCCFCLYCKFIVDVAHAPVIDCIDVALVVDAVGSIAVFMIIVAVIVAIVVIVVVVVIIVVIVIVVFAICLFIALIVCLLL